MKATRILIAATIVMMLAGAAARADFTRVLNFQGRLTDNNGVPVADGSQNVIFNLCTDAACTGIVWTEGPTAVTFTDGLFNVVLGSSTSLSTVDFNSAEYYLRVTIGATTYTPTQRVTGAAFAMNVPDSSITSAKVLDGTLTAGDLSVNVVSSVDGVTNDGLNIDLVAGSGITITPDDAANTITIAVNPASGGGIDHGGLLGLTDDDHTQYVKDAGDTMTGALVMSTAAGDLTFTNSGQVISNNAGAVTFGGAGIQISTGTLGVGGAATMASTLVVTGAATDSSTLNVVGATTLNSTLAVYGAVTGSSTVQGTQLISTVTTGTAPMTANSTTLVTNFNADYLDGQHGAYYMPASTDNWVNTTGDTMTGALTMTSVNINLNGGYLDYSDAVQEKELYYGAANTAGSYVAGVEGSTLYWKTGQYYRWYGSIAAADGGTSDKMELDTSTGNLTLAGDLTVNGYDLQMVRGDSSYIHKLGRITFDWTGGTYDDSSFHGIESEDEAGTLADSLRINSYSHIINTIDSNLNSTSYFKVQKESTGNGTDLLTLDESGNFYVLGDVSAGSYSTLDGRYVNVTGDTMSGALTISMATGPGLSVTSNCAGCNVANFTGGADDTSYEWMGYYSGATRYGIMIWDTNWSQCAVNDTFCLASDGGKNLQLASGGGTVYIQNAVVHPVDTTYALDFSAASTNDNRGISFNSRTALSADNSDGWLRLNNQSQFTSGIYTPGMFRADGGFQVDGSTVIDADGRYFYNVAGGTVNKWGGVNASGFGLDATNSGDWDLLVYESSIYLQYADTGAVVYVGGSIQDYNDATVNIGESLYVSGDITLTGNVYGDGINCKFVTFTVGTTSNCPSNHAVVAATDNSANRLLSNPGNFTGAPTAGYMICCPTVVPFP